MATLKKVWLDKRRFMNELHLLDSLLILKITDLMRDVNSYTGKGGTELCQNVPRPAGGMPLP